MTVTEVNNNFSNFFLLIQALRLSRTALGETTVGQIVNLLSNDVNRFDTMVIFLNYIWLGPLQTIVVTYFLWQVIGVSSIIGVAILLMIIPLQSMNKSYFQITAKYLLPNITKFVT